MDALKERMDELKKFIAVNRSRLRSRKEGSVGHEFLFQRLEEDKSTLRKLRRFTLPFDWDNDKLHKLDIPVTMLPIDALEWHLDVPFLDSYTLTPREVLNDWYVRNDDYAEECKRVRAADTKYPIDVYLNHTHWTILDGLHRFMKIYRKREGGDVRVRKVRPMHVRLIKP